MNDSLKTLSGKSTTPLRLSLVPDHVLLETYREYRRACDQLDASGLSSTSVQERAAALREATVRIEAELHARGIGDAPWWAERQLPRESVADQHLDVMHV